MKKFEVMSTCVVSTCVVLEPEEASKLWQILYDLSLEIERNKVINRSENIVRIVNESSKDIDKLFNKLEDLRPAGGFIIKEE